MAMYISRTLFLVLLLTGWFFSCKEKYPAAVVVSSPDYKRGEALMEINNDSAFYYFNRVAGTSRDSLQIANSYNNMAAIQSDAGDYFGSQESLLASLRYLHEKNEMDYYCLSSDYNELANTSVYLKNYDAASGYYDLALQFSRDKNFNAVFINNKATCFQKKGDYDKALTLYASIIDESRPDKKKYARVLSNMTRTRWLRDSSYNAAPLLLQALAVRKDSNDTWGLNASYAHLADYYARIKPDSALFYAEKRYSIAEQLQSPDDELEALQQLIVLSKAARLKSYFARYRYLNDSLQTTRNNAKNQFALIRYDAEKNKADNLQLQKDNADKKLQIIRQRIIMYGALLALLFGISFVVYWSRKRKQQLLLQSENALREQQIKTSQKVHDVVANGLYRIMSEVEYKENLEKEPLLDSLENLYEKSRDISYEQPMAIDDSFDTTLAAMLSSFAGPATKVLITGNSSEIWKGVLANNKQQLQLVLEELMVNMKKHSSAKNVVVKFERADNQFKIHYSDDGTGIAPSTAYGNGLRNTENRIRAMGGRIIFDKSAAKGLKIRIQFPINHP